MEFRMQRTTRPFVEKQLENLNRVAKMPLQPYLNLGDGKGIVPQAGNFHLDCAYGGYAFVRMSLTPGSSGTSAAASSGYYSLRKISEMIHAFACGYRTAKE